MEILGFHVQSEDVCEDGVHGAGNLPGRLGRQIGRRAQGCPLALLKLLHLAPRSCLHRCPPFFRALDEKSTFQSACRQRLSRNELQTMYRPTAGQPVHRPSPSSTAWASSCKRNRGAGVPLPAPSRRGRNGAHTTKGLYAPGAGTTNLLETRIS